MTTAPDRGTKCICTHCNTLFFDLNKQPPTCPKCKQKVAKVAKRSTRPATAKPKKKKAKKVTAAVSE